jgi:hypothetical protein
MDSYQTAIVFVVGAIVMFLLALQPKSLNSKSGRYVFTCIAGTLDRP